MLQATRSLLPRYGAAALIVTLVLWLTLRFPLARQMPLPFFVLAVLVSAASGGLGPGLLAAVYAALAIKFYLAPQPGLLPIRPEDFVSLGTLVLAALLMGLVDAARRRADEKLRRSEARYRSLARTYADGAVFLLDRDVLYKSKELLEGKTIWEALLPQLAGMLESGGDPEADEGAPVYETSYRDHIYAVHTLPLKNEGGETFAGMVVTQDITGRRRAEAELGAVKEKLEVLLRTTPLAVVTLDCDGRVESWNPAAERIFGWNGQDIAGAPLPGVANEHLGEFRARIEAALRGDPSDFETVLVAGDGERLDVRVRVAPLPGPQGDAIAGILVVVASLAERKQAEAREQIAEARYEGLLAGLTAAVVVTDAAGWYLDANPAACALLGYPREELLQLRVADLVARRPEAAEDQAARELIEGCWQGELELRRKDGTPVAVEVAGNLVELPGGPVCVAVLHDLTERKRAEAERAQLLVREHSALAEAENARKRTGTILESIDEAYLALDREWRLTFLNRRAEQILQGSRGDLLGKNIWELYPEAADLSFGRELHRALASDVAVRFEEFFSPLGLWLETRAYPSDGGLSVYLKDLTARKRAEARYEGLLAGLTAAVVVTDAAGWYLDANPAACALLGYPREELLQLRVADLVARRPEAAEDQAARELIEGCWQGELELRRKDGTPVAVEVAGNLVELPGGPVCVAVLHDLTERKRAEAEQAQVLTREYAARRHFAYLAEASTVLAGSLDYETTLSNVARLAVSALGDWCILYITDENGAADWTALASVDPEKAPSIRELRRQVPLEANGSRGTGPRRPADQPEIPPELSEAVVVRVARNPEQLPVPQLLDIKSCMTLPLRAGEETLGTMTIVPGHGAPPYGPAELALAEELARRGAQAIANARRHTAVRTASRGRDGLLAIASEELKRPLTALRAQAEQLERRQLEGASELDVRGLRALSEQALGLQQLIELILDVARIRSGQERLERRPLDLVALARRVVEQSQAGLGQHALRLVVPDETLLVEGDEARLARVLRTLVQNALESSPRGGSIAVQIGQRGERVSLAVSTGARRPAVAMGPGLFGRLRKPRNGHVAESGVGALRLTIVEELITLSGGTMEIARRDGEVERLTVSFPVSTPEYS